MTRALISGGAIAWIGLTLVLSQVRWFRRPSLSIRLAPFGPGGAGQVPKRSITSVRDIIAGPALDVGNRLARIFGVNEELGVRLTRVHSPLSVQAFRTRQLGWAVASFGVVSLICLTFRISPLIAFGLIIGAPLLAFLALEQQLAHESSRWQQRVFLELPVVSEQLGMLLAAGFSLGAGLNRLSQRGDGACATDLGGVCGRIRQGLDEFTALREWAATVQVDALDRLVAVLALNREASDLGRLITEEARSIRRDVQRELIESVERRAQQVWIPVTVATLVPGVLFLAVPFIEAMRLFTSA